MIQRSGKKKFLISCKIPTHYQGTYFKTVTKICHRNQHRTNLAEFAQKFVYEESLNIMPKKPTPYKKDS